MIFYADGGLSEFREIKVFFNSKVIKKIMMCGTS